MVYPVLSEVSIGSFAVTICIPKLKMGYPLAKPKLLLACATMVINDTMGEDGLVPSLLVFGIIPRFSVTSTDLPQLRTFIVFMCYVLMIGIRPKTEYSTVATVLSHKNNIIISYMSWSVHKGSP